MSETTDKPLSKQTTDELEATAKDEGVDLSEASTNDERREAIQAARDAAEAEANAGPAENTAGEVTSEDATPDGAEPVATVKMGGSYPFPSFSVPGVSPSLVVHKGRTAVTAEQREAIEAAAEAGRLPVKKEHVLIEDL